MAKRLRGRSLVAPNCGVKPASESQPVGMREMELSAEEAREMCEWIEHPLALPKRAPRDLPLGDPSLIR